MTNTTADNVNKVVVAFFKETVPKIFRDKPQLREEFNEIVQFEIEGTNGGSWFIDALNGQAVPGVSNKAICTVVAQAERFASLLQGPLSEWITAYLKGEIQLKGNLVRALRIRKLFEQYIT